MKYLKKFESERKSVRDLINERNLNEIKDIFTEIGDEGVEVSVKPDSVNTRSGAVLYSVDFRQSGRYTSLDEWSDVVSKLNKTSLMTIECVKRLESIGYKITWKSIGTNSTTDKRTSVSTATLIGKVQLWSK